MLGLCECAKNLKTLWPALTDASCGFAFFFCFQGGIDKAGGKYGKTGTRATKREWSVMFPRSGKEVFFLWLLGVKVLCVWRKRDGLDERDVAMLIVCSKNGNVARKATGDTALSSNFFFLVVRCIAVGCFFFFALGPLRFRPDRHAARTIEKRRKTNKRNERRRKRRPTGSSDAAPL